MTDPASLFHRTALCGAAFPALLALVLFSAFPVRSAPEDDLRVGLASAEITPPVPFRMSGGFSPRISTAVHDPLFARALVLRQGGRSVAFVICDLLGISEGLGEEVRRLASRAASIDPEHIVVAASHTHTGPLYYGARHDYYHRVAVEEEGADPLDSTAYREGLVRTLVALVEEASSAAVPARIDHLRTLEETLAFNRRFHLSDGTVRTNPGRLNPDIVGPAGPIDPEVDVLLVRDPEGGETRAAFTLYSQHLDTIGGTEISADFPFYLGEVLRESLGQELVALFSSAAAGDINHIDVSKPAELRGHAEAERIGTTLGRTIVAALPEAVPLAAPDLEAVSTHVHLPLKHFSQAAIAEAHAALAEGTLNPQVFEVIKRQQHPGQTYPFRVQAVRLDRETAIVALPSEIFVELGLAIKEGSPFPRTLVLSLASGPAGYIPTREAFEQGSYEPTNSRIQPGGGERLVEAALELLGQLADAGQRAD